MVRDMRQREHEDKRWNVIDLSVEYWLSSYTAHMKPKAWWPHSERGRAVWGRRCLSTCVKVPLPYTQSPWKHPLPEMVCRLSGRGNLKIQHLLNRQSSPGCMMSWRHLWMNFYSPASAKLLGHHWSWKGRGAAGRRARLMRGWAPYTYPAIAWLEIQPLQYDIITVSVSLVPDECTAFGNQCWWIIGR